MTRRNSWLALGGLAVAVALLAFVRPGTSNDAPDHRSSRDARNGTSALRLYAHDLGHPTGTIEGAFNLEGVAGLLFVFSPSKAFTAAEAQRLARWVTDGGALVYAAEQGDGRLDQKLGLKRSLGVTSPEALVPAPLLGGVHKVKGGDRPVAALKPNAQQVPLLRNPKGEVLAVTMRVGKGRVVALADPLELCNGYLDQVDNGRMAADIIALVVTGQPVHFDEFHHHLAAGPSATGWLTTAWGGAAGWAVLLLVGGAAMRGRSFGPPLPLAPSRERSSAEYASAVGALLQRAGARALTLQVLRAAARRSLAERVGLGRHAGQEGFPEILAQRAPVLAQRFAEAERPLSAGPVSEEALLRVAHDLHQLAYPPVGSGDPRKRPDDDGR